MAESQVWTGAERILARFMRRPRTPFEGHAGLSRVVETEVIPRLGRVSAPLGAACPRSPTRADHRPVAAFAAELPATVSTADIEHLTRAVLRQDLESARELLNERLGAGVSVETISLELLAGSARRLGDLWSSDRYDFSSVTLGTGFLQQLMRDLADVLDDPFGVPGFHHRILLLAAPGEQHTFGMAMLGDIFRRRGWDVWGGPLQERTGLQRLVAREHFDVIGYSVGADRWLEPLARELVALREHSDNGAVQVLIGGPAVDRCPALVEQLGGDAGAIDPRTAPDVALATLGGASAKR